MTLNGAVGFKLCWSTPTPDLAKACGLADYDLNSARAILSHVTDIEIARATGVPPDEWGVTIDEKVAVAKYIRSAEIRS